MAKLIFTKKRIPMFRGRRAVLLSDCMTVPSCGKTAEEEHEMWGSYKSKPFSDTALHSYASRRTQLDNDRFWDAEFEETEDPLYSN